jgi:hypothetical protein
VLAEEREARTATRASSWALVWSGVGEDEVGVVVEMAVVEEGVVVEGGVDDGAVDGSDDIFGRVVVKLWVWLQVGFLSWVVEVLLSLQLGKLREAMFDYDCEILQYTVDRMNTNAPHHS